MERPIHGRRVRDVLRHSPRGSTVPPLTPLHYSQRSDSGGGGGLRDVGRLSTGATGNANALGQRTKLRNAPLPSLNAANQACMFA